MSQAEKLPWVKIFSSRLSEAARGVKQTEISRKIGVGQSNVSMYLKGERIPSLDGFRSLCISLGVNADWLLGLTDSRGGGVSVTATGGSAVAAQSPGARVSARDAEVERLRGEVAALERALRMVAGKGDGRG